MNARHTVFNYVTKSLHLSEVWWGLPARMRLPVWLGLVFLLVLSSCSDVSENERYTYIEPQPAARCVLIEDFTGQRCVNCTRAIDRIEQLQNQFGADTVIAVGIHSGDGYGVWNSDNETGLRTAEGDQYFNYWNIEYQPMGVIDRSDGTLTDDIWSAKVIYDLQKTAPLSISLENTYDNGEITTTATIIGTDGTTTGKLQLWVVEDSIRAYQLMPNGSRNDDYIHNHVFRRSVNGTWGEDISVAEGQVVSKTYTISKDPTWNINNVSIVAFVYANDADGVRNVTKKSVL